MILNYQKINKECAVGETYEGESSNAMVVEAGISHVRSSYSSRHGPYVGR